LEEHSKRGGKKKHLKEPSPGKLTKGQVERMAPLGGSGSLDSQKEKREGNTAGGAVDVNCRSAQRADGGCPRRKKAWGGKSGEGTMRNAK